MARHSAAGPAPSSWRRAEPPARGAAPRTPVPPPHPHSRPDPGPDTEVLPGPDVRPDPEARPGRESGNGRVNGSGRESGNGRGAGNGGVSGGWEGRAVRTAPVARPSPWRGVARFAGGVLVLAVLAVAVAVAVVPAAVGGTGLTVLSPSMTPTYPVGSLVVIRPRPVEDIRIGDVVSFTSRDPATGAPRTVTHRVVGVDPGPSFRTKGDANADPDPAPVAADQVRGVAWYSLPMVGAWGSAVRSGPGLLIAAGAVLLVVALLFLVPRRR